MSPCHHCCAAVRSGNGTPAWRQWPKLLISLRFLQLPRPQQPFSVLGAHTAFSRQVFLVLSPGHVLRLSLSLMTLTGSKKLFCRLSPLWLVSWSRKISAIMLCPQRILSKRSWGWCVSVLVKMTLITERGVCGFLHYQVTIFPLVVNISLRLCSPTTEIWIYLINWYSFLGPIVYITL